MSSSTAPSPGAPSSAPSSTKGGKHGGKVVTRFPPEPNGYLHIGHAKAICVDFGIAKEFGGRCHLRMDDTNPTTEDPEYVEAIKRDVKWLGFDWGEHLYYASDYFERYYELGEKLIRLGRAYVCDLSEETYSKEYRGTISEPGKPSPFRERTVDENLDLFRRMRAGEFKDGERVLRARIDMASPNMKMRDPPLVRIKHAHHYRTGDTWCIYPLYDYAHCLEDSFEGVTHSLCTLEFESARELYDWVIQATEVPHVPKQTEFARLNITYMVMSKRKLLQLVEGKYVHGWDDPRMPTIAGLRRRGVTPEAIRELIARTGIAKNISTVDIALLEHIVRDDLDRRSARVMTVLRPLEVVIDSMKDDVEELEAAYWPTGTEPGEGVPAERRGSRKLPFSRVVYIDQEDFAEHPPKGWHRLSPGRKVRLRHAYIVTCTSVEKDADGNVVRVHCTHDPDTRGGVAKAGEKIDGTIHWVSSRHAVDVEVRVYDRLFVSENPGEGDVDFLTELNPNSLTAFKNAKAEPILANAKAGDRFQLERVGFFVVDEDSGKDGGPIVFNRTVALKDSWQKTVAKAEPSSTKAGAAKDKKPAAPPSAPGAPAVAAELSPAAIAIRDAYGLTADTARTLAQETALLTLFTSSLDATFGKENAKAVASLLVNDILGEVRSRKLESAPFDGAAVVELAVLLSEGTISKAQTKEVLSTMFTSAGKSPKAIVTEKGLSQIANADTLGPIVDEVLAANADAVGRYKAGNANVVGALVGMVMKKSGGRANAKLVKDLLEKKLAST